MEKQTGKLRNRASFSRALLALVALAAGAQQAPRPPAAQPTGTVPKFTGSANLVIVDVTVKDKAGKIIDNLTQNDFTVLEDGRPQKVEIFEHQQLSMETEPPDPPPALEEKNAMPEPPHTTIASE